MNPSASISYEDPTTKAQLVDEQEPDHERFHPQALSAERVTSHGLESSLNIQQSGPPAVNTPPPTAQSKHPKLDGVLYHFYSKTLAVITNCRLTHLDDSTLEVAVANTPTSTALNTLIEPSRQAGTGTPTTTPGRRASKWFELEIADYDFFREEVRLWRNVSTLIPSSILEGPTSLSPMAGSSHVPPMILDVILDTSNLTSKHLLTMDQSDPDGSTEKSRVRVDGKEWGTGPSSRRSSTGKGREGQDSEVLDCHRKPIVLETWRLELGLCNPPDPPDMPTLYRQATAHLKELFLLTKQLPAYPLFQRLQRSMSRRGQGEDDVEAELLNIGVRLGAERAEEQGEREDGICGVQEPLGPGIQSTKVTETFTFQPILTAIGIIYSSVEYRIDADFYVEDLDVAKGLRDLELDEDYFRPSASKAPARPTSQYVRPSTVGVQQSPLSASPLYQAGTQDGEASKPRSVLSATSDRRQSIIASEAGTSLSGSGRIATPSPPAELASRSTLPTTTTSTSVFSSTASSGKPVAGLSSLRRSPSVTSHGTSPTTTMTPIAGPVASSPGGTTTLSSDAAFLTHGRRTSMSERRLRTLSTLSGSAEKSSPPTSTPATSTPPSYHPSGRPILTRTSASTLPSLRSGSYSPSSPSPLAQQLSDHQQQSTTVAPNASFRMSSSPSYRTTSLPMSASPSLRSVFQSYTPSHSQASISSLSRTPPKSITEGGMATANNSSLGLQGGSTTSGSLHHSPSQSSLAEGRQQPSVAPQMIKRYSSTFNYRQGRQQSSGLTAGGGAAAAGGSGAVAGSSLESEGSGGGPYSKSWQARIEQRQMFTARSLGREEGSHFSGSSAGAFFASSYSPRTNRQSMGVASTSQEDELDDFVRMIDSSHPTQAASSMDSQAGPRGVSSMEGQRQAKVGLDNMSSQCSTASSSIGFNRHYGLNRLQVDEMLSKMQSSVGGYSPSNGSRGSGGSGGVAAATTPTTTTSSSSAGSGQSIRAGGGGGGGGGMGAQSGALDGSNNASPPVSQGVQSLSQATSTTSTSFARSPLSRVGFSAQLSSTNVASNNTAAAAIGSPATPINAGVGSAGSKMQRRPLQVERQGAYRYEVPAARREMHSQADQRQDQAKATALAAVDDGGKEEEEEEEEGQGEGERGHHAHRTASGGSLEMYATQPHSYDPLEDEAVGRLELVHDDLGSTEAAAAARGGGVGASAGNSHHHLRHPHHHIPTDVGGSEAAERRRSDIELARNFGQVVSSSSNRGNPRASLSPWRNRLPNPATGNSNTTSGSATNRGGNGNGGGGSGAG